MRNINLESLEVFRTVVEAGGVVRASGRLNRVPSNVTTRVKQLEARLGVRLFRREGRALTLTAEGVTLRHYADRLLRLAAETEAQLTTGRPGGTFRLGSLESTAGTRLPELLSRYHRTYPDVTLELATGTTGALLRRVTDYELEAAFVSEPFEAPHLHALPVFEEELVLITARGAALPGGAAIARATMIAFAEGCSYRRRLEQWIAAAGTRPARILEFASYQAIIACVAAGTGLAIVPRSVLSTLRAAEHVQTHALPAAIGASRTHLVWNAAPSPALEGLLALLDETTPAVAAPG